ncbi:hypothetical protein [Aureibacter tunicatorum]|uniref:DUF4468 domain-containing protein n=1 Tax=Aureibacter tunicatorum TaxID=866807 RepID=A0AAE3XL68_9BACT|nr:hypothetical protein [Aureibacter tunicatorum]MDR6238892.1 hypothetical protein [Aureibacter tunicatorum]BDD05181.1 hypothetical protein AUTU_26640 [Aureibacter tunicatorum]
MKTLYMSLLIICVTNIVSLAQNNPFENLEYTKVVAYEYKGGPDNLRQIEKILTSNKEKEGWRIDNSVVLSKKQIKKFEKLFTSESSYGSSTAACFDPHLAFVYFNEEKIVCVIDICLGCNYLQSSIKIPLIEDKIREGYEESKQAPIGFSKQARQEIIQFCKKMNFVKYIPKEKSKYD